MTSTGVETKPCCSCQSCKHAARLVCVAGRSGKRCLTMQHQWCIGNTNYTNILNTALDKLLNPEHVELLYLGSLCEPVMILLTHTCEHLCCLALAERSSSMYHRQIGRCSTCMHKCIASAHHQVQNIEIIANHGAGSSWQLLCIELG